MKDFFWKMFEHSGSVDAFLAYREYDKLEQINKSDTDKGIDI